MLMLTLTLLNPNICVHIVDTQNNFFSIIIIVIILWAGVQPTLDPYAEAFIAGPLR